MIPDKEKERESVSVNGWLMNNFTAISLLRVLLRISSVEPKFMKSAWNIFSHDDDNVSIMMSSAQKRWIPASN